MHDIFKRIRDAQAGYFCKNPDAPTAIYLGRLEMSELENQLFEFPVLLKQIKHEDDKKPSYACGMRIYEVNVDSHCVCGTDQGE